MWPCMRGHETAREAVLLIIEIHEIHMTKNRNPPLEYEIH